MDPEAQILQLLADHDKISLLDLVNHLDSSPDAESSLDAEIVIDRMRRDGLVTLQPHPSFVAIIQATVKGGLRHLQLVSRQASLTK